MKGTPQLADLIEITGPAVRRISPIRILGAMTNEECDAAIALGTKQKLLPGEMYTPIEGYRESLISLIPRVERSEWLYAKVIKLGQQANREFGFKVDFNTAIIQYTQYDVNGEIGWHTDYDHVGANPRKVSITIQLSNPKEYRGGALEFFPTGEIPWGKSKGTGIIFPSFLQHRVNAVTRGMRKSLVIWFSGPPFC